MDSESLMIVLEEMELGSFAISLHLLQSRYSEEKEYSQKVGDAFFFFFILHISFCSHFCEVTAILIQTPNYFSHS